MNWPIRSSEKLINLINFRMSELVSRLKLILQRINEITPPNRSPVRLIAISKTKPIADIIELYHAGQRYFGENYVEELEKKSNDNLIRNQCPDIRWHFVGHLQRKKVPRILTRVPNLDCIQTIDSIDLANRLNLILKQQSLQKLNILIQINTSNEKQKFGIEPKEFLSLYEYIKINCPLLICQGLMTIGSLNNVQTENNQDFQILIKCRDDLCKKYNYQLNHIELSMGMSHDYERAIQAGSTIIRVGSSIFGARQ
jgi:pyridoxal phosphate enzyme (YggS family)